MHWAVTGYTIHHTALTGDDCEGICTWLLKCNDAFRVFHLYSHSDHRVSWVQGKTGRTWFGEHTTCAYGRHIPRCIGARHPPIVPLAMTTSHTTHTKTPTQNKPSKNYRSHTASYRIHGTYQYRKTISCDRYQHIKNNRDDKFMNYVVLGTTAIYSTDWNR